MSGITIKPIAVLLCVRHKLQQGNPHAAEVMLNDAAILCADTGEPVPEILRVPARLIQDGKPKEALRSIEETLLKA